MKGIPFLIITAAPLSCEVRVKHLPDPSALQMLSCSYTFVSCLRVLLEIKQRSSGGMFKVVILTVKNRVQALNLNK